MVSFHTLVVRDDDESSYGLTPTIVKLLIVLFAFVILGMACTAALFLLRSIRRKRESEASLLPSHRGHCRKPSHRGGMTIFSASHQRNASLSQVTEKQAFLSHNADYTGSPSLPAIHITLPEDDGGVEKSNSKRVVVVRISDNGGVGLEPISEPLPPYQQKGGEWTNLDLERIGGLKEKSHITDKEWQ